MPRPDRVRLMFEHTVDLPLWDRTPGPKKWFGPIPRGALGLSVELEERLAAWNDRIEAALGPELAWPSPEARLDADVEGLLLAGALQEELGADMVVLYGDEGEPFQTPRATGPKCSSIIEQLADIPDAEFLEMTRGVAVIFPEASLRDSEPTPEMQAFVDRLRALGG